MSFGLLDFFEYWVIAAGPAGTGWAVEAAQCPAGVWLWGPWCSCTSHAARKFTWDGEGWKSLWNYLYLEQLQMFPFPFFHQGAVFSSMELVMSVTANKCCSYCKSKVQPKERPLIITCLHFWVI